MSCKKNLKVKNFCAKNGRIASLNTDSIVLNGKDITCSLEGSTPVEDLTKGFDKTDAEGNPVRNPKVNAEVFAALLESADIELIALRERLQNGREYIREFERVNSCAVCGPSPDVPVNIYGYITQPILTVENCKNSQELKLLQRMYYNLEVDYDVRAAQSTEPRVVSILCQLAYIDGPEIRVEELLLGTKQFVPTVDPLYGEIFNGTVPIDSYLAEVAARAMPDPNNTAAVQLVFYVEEGLSIWTPDTTIHGIIFRDGGNSGNTNQPGAATVVNFTPRTCDNPDDILCYDTADSNNVVPCRAKVNPSFTFTVDGKTVTFTNTTESDFALNYTWNFGDGGGGSEEVSPTYTYQASGTYQVILSVAYAPDGTVLCPGVQTATDSVTVE
jgi:hypothetical protein